MLGFSSDMFGMCSNRLSIGGSNSGFSVEMLTSEFRGRRSIWRGWRVTLLAPRFGNDVSYVTPINHEIHFAWQAQYLVRLEGDFDWK